MLGQKYSPKSAVSAPSLTSIYDVVASNLKNLNQKTFLTRTVYVVKSEMHAEDLINLLASNIHSISELGPLGFISGIHLAAQSHSIVMIEIDCQCWMNSDITGSIGFTNIQDFDQMFSNPMPCSLIARILT